MYHLHLTRNLRSFAFLLVVVSILSSVALLWWANRTGLPASWRAAIEYEISKQGAYVEIGALSYNPFRGVVASRVKVFSDAEKTHEISRLQNVVLQFDKTKLARGEVHITKVEFINMALTLPTDPNNPNAESIEVTEANGTLFMPGERRFEIRNAHGTIAGIPILFDARIIGYKANTNHIPNPEQDSKRRQLIARILRELNQWQFDHTQSPMLRMTLTGDANQPSTLVAKINIQATNLGKNHLRLKTFSADAELTDNLITVTTLHAKDSCGELLGHADYDITTREGRFDVRSSLAIEPLIRDWFATPPLKNISFDNRQRLEAEGSFHLDESNTFKLSATGHASCRNVILHGARFSSVKTAFSWKDSDHSASSKDGELFLRDIELLHAEGRVLGKAMIQWPLVRMAIDSTVPASVMRPFFIGQPLEKVIDDFTTRKDGSYHVMLEGGFDATDRYSWAYTGGGEVKNVSYKGVPVNTAQCRFSLSHQELDFFDGTVDFNYQDYPMRKEFDGPKHAITQVGRIRYDAPSKTVEVENVTGTFWAAPVVRLFAPKVADSLEVYRFHQPPDLKGNGVVDVTPQGRTHLEISFNSNNAANYRFLGEDITLTRPTGKVIIRGNRVTIDPLTLEAFDGPIKATFDFHDKNKLSGELSWTKLSIPALSSTYGFQMKGNGKMTGRIDFTLTDGKVETMSGQGLFALEQTELFSVPIFGPLSSLISGVLNDRRAGFERARNAFCNFNITNGILTTNDFQTATTSLVFLGDGSVNLKERTIDMTMRMNARGLLGIITLPLRPFYGLFQFRGSGPLKETKWENVMFTSPPNEQNHLLMQPPKAKIVQDRNGL